MRSTLPKWAKMFFVVAMTTIIVISVFNTVEANGGCPLTDMGVRLNINLSPDNDGLYHVRYDHPDLQAYLACNFLIEGRHIIEEVHHIYTFPADSVWELGMIEFSIWAFPSGWNMNDFGLDEDPMSLKFAASKQINMLENGYEYPIFIHIDQTDGIGYWDFPVGYDYSAVELGDNAQFTEPQLVAVYGIWDQATESYIASIDGDNVYVVAKIDGVLYFWYDSMDNIEYQEIEAWVIPSSWGSDEMADWSTTKFGTTPVLFER